MGFEELKVALERMAQEYCAVRIKQIEGERRTSAQVLGQLDQKRNMLMEKLAALGEDGDEEEVDMLE